jgi:NACalpha-BTF3-like transcription factor
MNMNPLAQFNLEGSGYSGTPFGNMTPKEIELYAKQMEVAQDKQKKMVKGKNGALVKAIKSM